MPTPTITLENIAQSPPRPITIHLEHAVYCAAAGDCRCVRRKAGSSQYDHAKKRRVVIATNVRLPCTVTVNAAGTVGDEIELHPAAKLLPDVKRALAARTLRVVAPKAATPQPAGGKPVLDARPTKPEVVRGRPGKATPATPPTAVE